jgi:hypothetical protein
VGASEDGELWSRRGNDLQRDSMGITPGRLYRGIDRQFFARSQYHDPTGTEAGALPRLFRGEI